MTQLLQHAFQLVSELSEDEQDKFARFILGELESELRWAELFERSDSEHLLECVADEALAEYKAEV